MDLSATQRTCNNSCGYSFHSLQMAGKMLTGVPGMRRDRIIMLQRYVHQVVNLSGSIFFSLSELNYRMFKEFSKGESGLFLPLC